MKRALCAWLPGWPVQRLCRARPELCDRPLVLFHDSPRRGLCVAHCSRRAAEQGVAPGMPLAEGKALLEKSAAGGPRPAPHFERHDPQGDLTALQALAEWARRFSPLIGLEEDDPPDCLVMDVTGCTPHFGGEAALAAQVQRELARCGLVSRVALADTVGAAWAVSHYGRQASSVVPAGGNDSALHPLPVAALRLAPPLIETLHELGIRTIGQLQELPRQSLPARFGPSVVLRLDEALGCASELIPAEHPAEPVEAERLFEEPIADRQILERVLQLLVEELTAKLQERQAGVQRLSCSLHGPACEPVSFSVGTVSPTASMPHLWELIRLRLERLAWPGEVSRVRLEATMTGPLVSRQGTLVAEDRGEGEQELARLVNRLSGRLGDSAVLRPRLCSEAQPELAGRFEPILAAEPRRRPPADAAVTKPSTGLARPLRLKPEPVAIQVVSVVPDGPPIRFQWNAVDHRIRLCWGPERIETGWWRDRCARRDYYRVETTDGHRFWLFRAIDEGTWFLHGTFD